MFRPLLPTRLNNVASIATSGHFYQAILSLTIQQGLRSATTMVIVIHRTIQAARHQDTGSSLNNPRLSSFIRISQGPLDHMAGGAVGSHCRHLHRSQRRNGKPQIIPCTGYLFGWCHYEILWGHIIIWLGWFMIHMHIRGYMSFWQDDPINFPRLPFASFLQQLL